MKHGIRTLEAIFKMQEGKRVPAIVHLIKTDSRPVTRFLMLNILSILHNLNPASIYLHVTTPPHGFFWNLTLNFNPDTSKIIVQKISTPILLHGKAPLFRRDWEDAHKSDIIRMNILKSIGGIYMDTDVLVLRSFDPLRESDFTMGLQVRFIPPKNLNPYPYPNRNPYPDFTMGLQTFTKMCNGVMLAHPQSSFLVDWYNQMSDANFTTCWDCHSIELPSKLWAAQKAQASSNASWASARLPRDIPNILPLEAFYDPSFSRSDLHELFREQEKGKRLVAPYEGKYAVHLWNRVWVAAKYLTNHRLEEICFSRSMYNEMLRFALSGSAFLRVLCGTSQT